MNAKTYRVKDVARISGVTVRALHHYDSIGLLVPSGRSESGYRLYDEDDLLRLQQILLGRELGLPLEEIRRTLDDPELDRERVLLEHRARLVQEGRRVDARIRAVDAALEMLRRGDETMDMKELFDGFDPKQYEEEAEERWGDSNAYKESMRRTKRYTKQDWIKIKAEEKEIMKTLASKLEEGATPDDRVVIGLAERHRLHLDRWFYPCSHQMHVGLAEMYVADDRFRAAFEKHGIGMAEFLAEAIRANAAEH